MFKLNTFLIIIAILLCIICPLSTVAYSQFKFTNLTLWFKQAALEYQKDKPLHHFSRWNYWSTEDWVKHIKWGVTYLDPPLQDGNKVFESGCGVGAYLQTLKSLYPNIMLSGIDIVPEAIQVARNVLPGNFYVGDAKSLIKEQNDTYDYSFSNCVIGYLNNLSEAYQMVAELIRITKKGRPIMISTIIENNNHNVGSLKLFIRKSWWHENAASWNVQITTISRMGDWPGAQSQGDRYAVFMKKL